MDICTPIVENMKLQIRFNVAAKCVELKTSPATESAMLCKRQWTLSRPLL